jgi:hypothetical protein
VAEERRSYAAGEVRAPIAAPQAMQFQICRQEMIEAALHPFDFTGNQIKLDRIQGPCRRSRAEMIILAADVSPLG